MQSGEPPGIPPHLQSSCRLYKSEYSTIIRPIVEANSRQNVLRDAVYQQLAATANGPTWKSRKDKKSKSGKQKKKTTTVDKKCCAHGGRCEVEYEKMKQNTSASVSSNKGKREKRDRRKEEEEKRVQRDANYDLVLEQERENNAEMEQRKRQSETQRGDDTLDSTIYENMEDILQIRKAQAEKLNRDLKVTRIQLLDAPEMQKYFTTVGSDLSTKTDIKKTDRESTDETPAPPKNRSAVRGSRSCDSAYLDPNVPYGRILGKSTETDNFLSLSSEGTIEKRSPKYYYAGYRSRDSVERMVLQRNHFRLYHEKIDRRHTNTEDLHEMIPLIMIYLQPDGKYVHIRFIARDSGKETRELSIGGGKWFSCLESLIAYYQQNPLPYVP